MPGLRATSARLGGGRRRRRHCWWLTAASVAMLAACHASTVPATIHPTPSVAASPASTQSETVSSVRSSADPTDGTTIPEGSPRIDLEPVDPARLADSTLICERWGPDPPPSLISCGDAARLALAALGAGSASVTRLEVGYGEWCEATDAPCSDRLASVAWVVARTAAGASVRFRIARADSGAVAVWPPIAGPRMRSVAFDPPPRRAPAFGVDTPPALAAREAAPFCGDENLGQSERFATTARHCFLTAVLAESPAEIDSHATSTEGDAVLTVYRFEGVGAIRRWVRSAGVWVASACGIAPIDTPAVFEMAGVCVTVRP